MEKKEAMKILKEFYDKSALFSVRIALDTVIPELNESEDKKIRKALINVFSTHQGYEVFFGASVEDILAWLEKQGEQFYWKPSEEQMQTLHAQLNEGAVTYPEDKRILFTLYEDLMKIMTQEEKQGEQKPNKIRSKFKVGDCVAVNPKLRFASPLCIKDIDNNNYRVESVDGNSGAPTIDYLDRHYHLWTIQDAKDGDVLYHKSPLTSIEYIVMSRGINGYGNIDSYFRYNSEDGFDINVPSVFDTKRGNITPATKEQRDLLFTKMKEAGYEWDAEMKELEKIEDKKITL